MSIQGNIELGRERNKTMSNLLAKSLYSVFEALPPEDQRDFFEELITHKAEDFEDYMFGKLIREKENDEVATPEETKKFIEWLKGRN